MASRYMSWCGHRIHVTEAGVGDPLLLIAVLGCNTEMWGPFPSYLPERRMIRYDAPGTGLSSTPAYPISVAELARLTVAVLDDCGISSTDVIGYSYGGGVAQQLAFEFPERVERLVLAATTCGVGMVFGSPRAMTVLATPFRYYSPHYFDRTAAMAYGGRTARNPRIRHQMMLARRVHPPSYHGYAMQLLAGMSWSSLAFLDRISHETLVICGDDDPLIPIFNPEWLARRIPRAELDIVPDAGHLFLWDDAENTGGRIGRFIERGRRRIDNGIRLRA